MKLQPEACDEGRQALCAPIASSSVMNLSLAAIRGYISMMTTVSIRDAKNRLTELARQVEGGESIVVTRHGKPVFDVVPQEPRAGLNFDAIADFKRRRSVSAVATYVAEDFDAPLPEDFLLNPLPPRS